MKDAGVISGSEVPLSTASSLLARLRGHDPDAWQRLVTLYGPLVYSWARRRGLQAHDAADLLQEVFRTVVTGIGGFQTGPNSSFRGWLWTITRSRILDWYRRHQRSPLAVGGSDAQARWTELPEALDETASDGATASLVQRALALIRPDFSATSWQAFCQVVLEGRPADEVARELGLTANAVYIAKSRVLRRLRDELAEDFG